jgi:predicted Zn-dependent protease
MLAKMTPAASSPSLPVSVTEARKLLAAGDLGAAEGMITRLREADDGAEVQELLAVLAERKGNRLSALAHQHRATRMRPRDPQVRSRLAQLLIRLGQPEEACKQARSLIEIDPHGPGAASAHGIFAQARCKEAH